MKQQENETQTKKNLPAQPTPQIKTNPSDKPEVGADLENDGWKNNPGRNEEPEMPNELYNETLPPDTRLV